jgi:hypothetical protein
MRTQINSKYNYILYLTKHLRADLHDRLRVQAALRGTTLEDVFNKVIATGLPLIEDDTTQQRKQRKLRGTL